MKKKNFPIGNTSDPRCKQNMIRFIDRKTCRNNCKYWGYLKEKNKKGNNKRGCLLGY